MLSWSFSSLKSSLKPKGKKGEQCNGRSSVYQAISHISFNFYSLQNQVSCSFYRDENTEIQGNQVVSPSKKWQSRACQLQRFC